jgi:hypothetical protein
MVIGGSFDGGEFSWVIGNNAKWLNRNPARDHAQPLSFISCNATLTLSNLSSNITAFRLRASTDLGNFAQYSLLLPNDVINILDPSLSQTIGAYSQSPLALTPGSVLWRTSDTGQAQSTLGPMIIWYDISLDGGWCRLTGSCIYIYQQSRLAFSEEAQTIMQNHITEGEDTTGIRLTGALTTKSFECTSRYAEEWIKARNFSMPYYIPTMIPQVDIVVSVFGALSHSRNLPSNSDNFQMSFEFDRQVTKTLTMLMSLMTYSLQCDAKYYVWWQCTQAPSWLIMFILLLFDTSMTFAAFLYGGLFWTNMLSYFILQDEHQ